MPCRLSARFAKTALSLLAAAAWSAPVTAALPPAPAGSDGAFVSYFKQQRPLTERPGQLALFDRQPLAAKTPLAEALQRANLNPASVREHAVDGWVTAETSVAPKSGSASMRAVVDEAAGQLPSRYVTPVFADSKGNPLFPTPVILIRFEDNVTEAEAVETLASLAPGKVLDRGWAGMAGAYRVESDAKTGYDVLDAANKLAARPDVKYAEPDMVFTGKSGLTPNDPGFAECWGIHNTAHSGGGMMDEDMDGPEAWDLAAGNSSVKVLVLDTGVQQNHPDINQLSGYDATGHGTAGGPGNGCDVHGTPVAGCVTATMNNGLGTVGIAPGCRVISARVGIADTSCDGTWTSQNSWTVNALAWGQTQGARVSNNSNDYGPASAAITDKYNSTYAAGMVHFAAAGNDGSSTIAYPSSLANVNSVAALGRDGDRASFSDYGSGLDFSAPGVDVYTTDRTGSAGYEASDYVYASGTSFASPYAAGVAALLISANSALTPAQVEEHLRQSCVDKGAAGYDTGYGWGALNAHAALQRVLNNCVYSISDSAQAYGDGGGNGSFGVGGGGICGWMAIPSAGWLSITSGAGGSGNGTVNYTVAPNPGPARTARITVSNRTHTVTQSGISSAPANDMFAAAGTLSGTAGSVSAYTVNGSREAGEPSHAGNTGGASVWWKWTAPASGTVLFDTNGSAIDTVMGVYTGGAVSALGWVSSDDDSGDGRASALSFTATAGTLYHIAVDGYNGVTGAVSLNWIQGAPADTYHNPTQMLSVASTGPGFQVLYFNYTSGAAWTSPFYTLSAKVPFIHPSTDWVGLFLYDYGAGRFTQGVYRNNHGL